MKRFIPLFILLASTVTAEVDRQALPAVEEGFSINFFVQEPHIINPSALCFDKQGRLFVGAGPQYRNPKEDSPTDYIKILIDKDGDGIAETVKTFAEGLNSVQSMAWRGNELWVANSPELTVLRDTNGDDVADEYQVIYTGLNNLRHGLHGLNWGPDGWLYMTIGNTWVKPNAPKPIRDLQKISSDDNTEYPLTKIYTKDTYPKSYHPLNKSEKEGGIFRCRPGGYDLELWARGMRNPWDMCMDSGFNWLATDNDIGPPGDRVFMPVRHGHYGFRHPWKFDWMGKHPAVAPSSDIFPEVSGSGTGVIFYDSNHFPKQYQGTYLIANWTQSCIYWYQPKWDGALQVPAEKKHKLIRSSGGHADLQWRGEKGRALFRPTDMEVGPDGAIYIAGWGSVYGTTYVPKDKWTEEENAKYEGRVFRFRHQNALIPESEWKGSKRQKTHAEWTIGELIEDLGQQLPVWRVDAQVELVRRGAESRKALLAAITGGKLSEMANTWAIWTVGLIDKDSDHAEIRNIAEQNMNLNLRIQATRILGENRVNTADSLLLKLLDDPEPRIRVAAMDALDKIGWGTHADKILQAISDESDRVASHVNWQVMRRQLPESKRRALLNDSRFNVRRLAALGLMQEGDRELQKQSATYLDENSAPEAGITILGSVHMEADEPAFRKQTVVSFKALLSHDSDKASTPVIRYALNAEELSSNASVATAPQTFSSNTTIKAALYLDQHRVSEISEMTVRKIPDSEWKDRLFVQHARVIKSGARLRPVDDGLQRGVLPYHDDKGITITDVPAAIAGATLLPTRVADKTLSGHDVIHFDINLPAHVYVAWDSRTEAPSWLTEAFQSTTHQVKTSHGANLTVYQRDVDSGTVILGGNSNAQTPYQVYVRKADSGITTVDAVKKQLAHADLKHGEELFFGRGTCFACHKIEDKGFEIGPGLVGIAQRRDTNYVIDSILNPDSYIVEGYQQTSLKLKDGRQLFGMIQEETELTIKLALPTGEMIEIDAGQVVKRDDAENSGMPGNFAHTLSPKDVASLTAWIMSLTEKGPTAPVSTDVSVEHLEKDKKVSVKIGGEVFTEYLYGNRGKPILYPVIGPGNIAMTRHYPMKPGVPGEASDHPHHQSIHFNHPVNGIDFWHGKGGAAIRNESIVKAELDGNEAVIISRNNWTKGKERICSDVTEIRAGITPSGRYIDYKVTIQATDGDVRFENSKEGTMAIRTHPELRLQGDVAKGSAINSESVSGKDLWGKAAKWVDYWGPVEGKTVGIAIFDHPNNPRHPTTWHARDYGLVAANPFGSNYFKTGEGAMTIQKGDSATFLYRFLFHEGTQQQADIPGQYEAWHTQAPHSEPSFTPLFNGKDLSNFQSAGAEEFWRIENGVLIGENNAAKNEHYLWTEKDYGDFTLEFDARWKGTTPRGVDTGIEMRKPHLQLQLGISGSLRVDMSGSFYAAGRGYPESGRANKAKELMNAQGEWNRFRIQARGNTFTCWINGKKASEYTDPKYSGAGPLGFQIHGGVIMKCEFRNMRIAIPDPEQF